MATPGSGDWTPIAESNQFSSGNRAKSRRSARLLTPQRSSVGDAQMRSIWRDGSPRASAITGHADDGAAYCCGRGWEDLDVHRGWPGSLPPRLESSCWAIMIWRLGIPNGPPPWFACLRAGPGFTAGAGVPGRARLVGVAINAGMRALTRRARFRRGSGTSHDRIGGLRDASGRRTLAGGGQSLDQAAAVVVEDLERAAAALTARTAPHGPSSGVLVAAAGVLLKAEPAVSSGHGTAQASSAAEGGPHDDNTAVVPRGR